MAWPGGTTMLSSTPAAMSPVTTSEALDAPVGSSPTDPTRYRAFTAVVPTEFPPMVSTPLATVIWDGLRSPLPACPGLL